jgi:hypothetical protein
MKHFLGEIIVAVVFLTLLFVLLNPWNVFMPTYIEMVILAALAVFFGIFANFIWREKGGDERQQLHSMFADRIAFLTGSGILLVSVIVGELYGQLNPWILFTLAAMVVAKVAGLIYTKIKL